MPHENRQTYTLTSLGLLIYSGPAKSTPVLANGGYSPTLSTGSCGDGGAGNILFYK